MLSRADQKHYRELLKKNGRQANGQVLVFGKKMITEAYQEKALLEVIITSNEKGKSLDWVVLDGITIHEVTTEWMGGLDPNGTPSGMVGVCRLPEIHRQSQADHQKGCMLYLDGVSDPGNMGSILRSADWYGASSVYLGEGCVDVMNEKVVASSVGAIFRVPLVEGSAQVLAGLRASGVATVATLASGGSSVLPKQPLCLVLGSESHGIRGHILAQCSGQYSVSARGRTESLNVAVAAAVLLDRVVR
jgi:RNA methyltransferase, TrmH family